jgi:signal transduction histidine kinase
MIGRVAALDFSSVLTTSQKNDMIDAIALGLNMLSEELNSNVVEKSKLDQVNRKLEQFAYTTAHDLKSPLNAITGLVCLLELTLNPDESSDVYQYINRLKKTTEQMKNLVQGILNYSKADLTAVAREEVDLNVVVKEIVETDQLTDFADIRIIGTLPEINFNRSAMNQIIRNLLSNAIKYSDKDRCRITLQAYDRGTAYCISVSDNGPGIAEEDHHKIFELFNTLDPSARYDSHGIGLATVKNILEAFDERIWVESIPGNGATFSFTLKKSTLTKNAMIDG